jgi:hypothetical protein
MKLPERHYQNKEGSPRYKRILKRYDEFTLCVNIGDAGYVGAEDPSNIYTLYLYVIKGRGKVGSVFDPDYQILDAKDNKLVDVSRFLYKPGAAIAETNFYYIGFNTLDKNVKWDGRLILNDESSLIVDKPNSYFVCLNGDVTINDKQFKRFDYASVNVGKEYQIQIAENSALGLFSKLN